MHKFKKKEMLKTKNLEDRGDLYQKIKISQI